MSSPQKSPPTADRSSILAAIERRSAPQPAVTPSAAAFATPHVYTDFDKDHDKRQEFRRLIDPGITRPNPRAVALNALKTLQQLAENILDHPGEPKYQRFKPTNNMIRARVIDPKGTLEYAIALGFRPEIENFQPFYVWHTKYLNDLKIGVAVLKEAMERENEKEERLERARLEEKAVADAQKAKIKEAFLDDRKSKMMTDERERQLRLARAARGSRSPISESEAPPPPYIPGAGMTLAGGTVDAPSPVLDMDDD